MPVLGYIAILTYLNEECRVGTQIFGEGNDAATAEAVVGADADGRRLALIGLPAQPVVQRAPVEIAVANLQL